MANPVIKVKRSSVVGKVPIPSQLERGELAVNSYDGKVYIVKDQFSVGIATTTTTVNPWLETGVGVGLSYSGDVKIVGILTVGSSSLTLDGSNNTVNVGTALTLGHSQGLQFHTQNLHSTGFDVNQIKVSGISTFENNVNISDNKKILFGASDDLEIFHQTSNGNSIIKETGGGILSLQTNGSEISFYDITNSVIMSQFQTGGACIFRHGATVRLQTASAGITVTGNSAISGNVTAVDATFSGALGVTGNTTFTGKVFANHGVQAVSYTHLTLPTKRIV